VVVYGKILWLDSSSLTAGAARAADSARRGATLAVHSMLGSDAGFRLLAQLRPAIDQVVGALEDLDQERSRPFGRLRLYAIHMAVVAVITPI